MFYAVFTRRTPKWRKLQLKERILQLNCVYCYCKPCFLCFFVCYFCFMFITDDLYDFAVLPSVIVCMFYLFFYVHFLPDGVIIDDSNGKSAVSLSPQYSCQPAWGSWYSSGSQCTVRTPQSLIVVVTLGRVRCLVRPRVPSYVWVGEPELMMRSVSISKNTAVL